MLSWRILNMRLAGVLLAAGAALTLAAGCGKTAAGPGGAAGPREPAPVRVGKVLQQSFPLEYQAVGNVEACSTIEVKSQVAGQIVKVHFSEGSVVDKDQVLFTIDPRPFEVALKQAEANRARAEAQLEQSAASKQRDAVQAENAQRDLERDKPLVEKNMVSREEFDQVKANAEALRAAVAADEAAVKAAAQSIQSAKAEIEDAKLQLDYCTVRSPIQGRTGSVLIHEGNLVRANDTSAMVVITQIKPIYVSFTLTEKKLPKIQEQMAKGPLAVSATIPGTEGPPEEGTLSFIDNAVNEDTGTIRMKATFANEAQRLWPGQFISVIMHVDVLADAVVVPSDAIRPGQSGSYAYVVKPDMTVEMRMVEMGDELNGLTIIREGLSPGEQVITDGQLRTAPGGSVRIVTDTPAAKDAQ